MNDRSFTSTMARSLVGSFPDSRTLFVVCRYFLAVTSDGTSVGPPFFFGLNWATGSLHLSPV